MTITPRKASTAGASSADATATLDPAPPGFQVTNSISRGDQIALNGLDIAPPDTQIAAGPTATVEVVNDMFSISPRGGQQSFYDLNDFILGNSFLSFIVSDPKIVYDMLASRWYLTVTSFDNANDSMVFLAVSETTDPTGYWWIYRILDLSSAHVFCDQPHLGFSADNIVVTCDYYNANEALIDTGYMVVAKSGSSSGQLYEYVRYFGTQYSSHMSMQPVYSMTATNGSFLVPARPVEYLVYFNGYGLGVLGVWGNVQQRTVGWGESLDQLVTAPQSIIQGASQAGGYFLDPGDYRILSAVIRNNVIWLTSPDSCTPAGSPGIEACIRLNQVDVSSFPHPRLTLDYDIGIPNVDVIYPAITLDQSGTAYIAFTLTGGQAYPEFDILDILPASPGQVDQAFQIAPGRAAYSGPGLPNGWNRWGDYSGAAPDPNDAHGVVLAGEWANSGTVNNWATTGGLFRVPACESVNVSYGGPNFFYPGPSVDVQAIPLGCWGTPQLRFWKRPPNGAWSVVQDYGPTDRWTWDSSKETVLGTYTFEVDARSQGFLSSYDAVSTFTVTLASPSTCIVSATPNPTSPAPTGAVVQISGSTDCLDPVYRFWTRAPGGAWTVAQPYGPSDTFNWSAGAPGTYTIEVDVKTRLDPASKYGSTSTFSYVRQACTGAALSANPTSPQRPATAIQVTGAASCPGTATYRFWVRPPGGAWTVKQNYGPSATFDWSTTGLAQGMYGLEVDVRNQGASSSYETVATLSYVLTTAPCAPSLSVNPAPPGTTGATATFSAAPMDQAGCSNPQYRFWTQAPGQAWTVAQSYGPASTFAFKPGLPGTYNIEVDARDASSSAPYDGVATMAYRVIGCSSAGLTATPDSGQMPGTDIVLRGAASCPGTPNYRFWIRAPGGPWQVKQDYGASATYNWSTTGLPLGYYGVEVDVRDAGAAGSYEAVATSTFVLGVQPCARPTLTANPTSPSASGTFVTLTATTSGCPNPNYRFWLKPPGGVWYSPGYGTLNTYTINGTRGGLWTFEVDVRDQTSTVSYDAVTTIAYEFDPCTSATLTGSPLQSPQGPVINFTATSVCPNGGSGEYRFWVKNGPLEPWRMVEDYPQGVNNYMWQLNGKAPGTYYFEVDVRNRGTNVAYETVARTTWVIT